MMNNHVCELLSPPSPPVIVLPPRPLSSSCCIGWRVNTTLDPKSSLLLFVLSSWTLGKKKYPRMTGWWWRWGETALKKTQNSLITSLKKRKQ